MAEHGTVARYQAGCRATCCTEAKAADRRRRELLIKAGHEFQVPSARSIRKIHALMALGWSGRQVADLMHITQQAISRIMARDVIRASTAYRIDRAYDTLEMQIPVDDEWTRRTKNYATKAGWLPPLAYDDIDAGIVAEVGSNALDHDDIDEIAVENALQYHDFDQRFTRAEKEEIVRRWTRTRSERSLCALTGWREGRYSRKDAA